MLGEIRLEKKMFYICFVYKTSSESQCEAGGHGHSATGFSKKVAGSAICNSN